MKIYWKEEEKGQFNHQAVFPSSQTSSQAERVKEGNSPDGPSA